MSVILSQEEEEREPEDTTPPPMSRLITIYLVNVWGIPNSVLRYNGWCQDGSRNTSEAIQKRETRHVICWCSW